MLDKRDLHNMANLLPTDDSATLQHCINFILADTKGHWHNRARAMLCRRLKHCTILQRFTEPLVAGIIERLVTGQFYEQFGDQLRLAAHLDPQRTYAVARHCLTVPVRDHVRRYALRILDRQKHSPTRQETARMPGLQA